MLQLLHLTLGLALTSLPALGPQDASQAGLAGQKIDAVLAERMQAAAADELLPVDIVLFHQVPQQEIDQAAHNPNKRERRHAVTTLLREMADATQGDLLAFLEAAQQNGSVGPRIDRLWIGNLVSAHMNAEVVRALAARDDVGTLHYDPPRGAEILAMAPPSPVTSPPTCGLSLIGAPSVWNDLGVTGRGVVVGVIDTGLCAAHSDIRGQLWINPLEIRGNGIDDDANGFVDDILGWNFESNNANINDTYGHGSHTSGTVGGDGTGGMQCGVAPDARIMSCKFWNSFSGEQSVWSGMQYGVANGADVLTASLGWPHGMNPNRPMWRQVCENAISAGVVVVYAAGNEGCGSQFDNVRTPGDVPGVITVGAVDCNNSIAGFSSCGPVTWSGIAPYNDHPFPPGLVKPDISAPGVGTMSNNYCNGYMSLDGTSMATPHVAGLAALILEADPTLDQVGVKAILEATALDLGNPGKDNSYGSGRIRAVEAVQMALNNGNFCGAKRNSCGTLPLITANGTPSATSINGFTISAFNTAGQQVGILLYTENGSANIPLLGGSLCLNGFRRAVAVTDTVGAAGQCNGVLNMDMNAFRAGLLGGVPDASLSTIGATIVSQYWGRDPANSFSTLFTAAFPFTVCP